MWCIGRITAEYRERMYDLLGLYAEPYDAAEPVVCLDEKSKQLLQQTRRPIAAGPGQIAKEDYEYKRAGTRNLFVAVEPSRELIDPEKLSATLWELGRDACNYPEIKRFILNRGIQRIGGIIDALPALEVLNRKAQIVLYTGLCKFLELGPFTKANVVEKNCNLLDQISSLMLQCSP